MDEDPLIHTHVMKTLSPNPRCQSCHICYLRRNYRVRGMASVNLMGMNSKLKNFVLALGYSVMWYLLLLLIVITALLAILKYL